MTPPPTLAFSRVVKANQFVFRGSNCRDGAVFTKLSRIQDFHLWLWATRQQLWWCLGVLVIATHGVAKAPGWSQNSYLLHIAHLSVMPSRAPQCAHGAQIIYYACLRAVQASASSADTCLLLRALSPPSLLRPATPSPGRPSYPIRLFFRLGRSHLAIYVVSAARSNGRRGGRVIPSAVSI
ncbi:hypothetical protein BJY52DRAFT_1268659, partial [Lactarius psammicola]